MNISRGNFSSLVLISTVVLWLPPGSLTSAEASLSQQLLQAYFDTAGVCTTSQVVDIVDEGDLVTISIAIEPATRRALATMKKDDRDNWFSLHCPPEIHGVWLQPQPPGDVLVTGLVGENELYTLSCVQFQHARWENREPTLGNKLRLLLEKLQ